MASLTDALARMEPRHLIALHRVAKTRCAPFFTPARAMIALREAAKKAEETHDE